MNPSSNSVGMGQAFHLLSSFFHGARRASAAGLVLLGLAAVPAIQAQDPATDSPRRFAVGGRIGVFATDLMNSAEQTIGSSSPPYRIQSRSTSAASRLSGGATIEVDLTERISVSLDILYRKVGYNAVTDIIEGVDDPETSLVDERVITSFFESTRANYWDVPVVVRVYHLDRSDPRPRAFFDLGVALRRVSNVRTYHRQRNPDESVEIDETATDPAHSSAPGVVLGGGFQFRGASGIRITPEVRYTRWLSNTFDASPTRSTNNQVELLLGITF